MAKFRRLYVDPETRKVWTSGKTMLIPRGEMVQDLSGLQMPGSEGRKKLSSILRKVRGKLGGLELFRGMRVVSKKSPLYHEPMMEPKSMMSKSMGPMMSKSMGPMMSMMSMESKEDPSNKVTLLEAFASDKARKAYFAKKIRDVLREWKSGKLHSGRSKTPVPPERKDWALAIALSVARKYTEGLAKHKRKYSAVKV